MRFAITALSAEHDVGEHGNIIIPPKLIFAPRAMGIRLCKAHILGNAVNYNVQKTADAQAENCRKNIKANQVIGSHIVCP